MKLRLILALLLTLILPGIALAQGKVRTETIRPPGPEPAAPASPAPAAPAKPDSAGAQPSPKSSARVGSASPEGAAPPEIITDVARLPAPVARTRERILAAARSGDLQQVLGVMQGGATMPTFSISDERDPIAYWKANYPDSDGVEILAILSEILEAGFVHADPGTPQEMYLWPYFVRMPMKSLTPQQKVELFRIITGNDYKEMVDFGAYIFYRIGIAPDGTWHYFVSGD